METIIKESIGICKCITDAVKSNTSTRIIKMYAEESERINARFRDSQGFLADPYLDSRV